MRWRLLLIGTLALAQRARNERRQGRNAYKTRRNRRLDGTRRRRWGTTEPLTGTNVCGDGDRRYCCPGWRQRKDSSECNIPICAPNACGDGICHSPGMCRCADGKLRKRCNEDEFFETEARCSSLCQNGGRCINGECECPEGFTGAHCGQPICGANIDGVGGCRNGGRCIGVDKCACVYGFYGDNCENDYRVGPCFGKIDKSKNECSDQVLSEYSTKEQCCATVGQAWGDPCEECPARPGNCGRGYDSNCNNINECIDINGICKGCQCRDTIGSFVCIAPEGFYFDEEKNECLDVDECAGSPCGADNECSNLPGGYSCECAEGFIKTVDEDGKQTCIDNRPGTCYEHVSSSVCTDPLSKMLTKTQCCCLGNFASSPGQCFQGQESSGIDNCPTVGTEAYSMLCDNAETINPKDLGPDGSGTDPITDICESKGLCEKGVCITDEKGIPMCLCDNGYEPETVELQCRDINECDTGEGKCENGRCVNTDGGWYCECDAGYVPSGNGRECENVDECAEGLAQCANGKCIDRDGSWACACDDGFQPDPLQRNQKCIDIDECNIGGNKCANGICSNVIGDYQCVCEVGYERGPDRKSCHDIDECSFNNACINGECKNTPGSYRCACNKGYKYNPEQGICENIDECEYNPCQGGTCTDTDGDFKCECGKYQMLDATGRRCIDQPNGQCFRSSNKNGRKCAADSMLPNQMSRQDCCCHAAELDRTSSFRLNNKCDVCPAVGTANFNQLCKGSEKPDNYCDLELNPCGNNGQCYDVDGGYECQCDEGYELHPSGTLCIDSPECDTKCLNGLCTELDGSFECVCPSGHHFNDKTGSCDDDDECLERPCSGGSCINAPGGFECVCAPGLVLDETGLICLDKREEACWLEHEDDTCVDNIPGRYTAELCCATQGKAWGDECVDCNDIPLTCRKGYVFDRVADRCVEVDECQLFPQYCSGNGAKCVNTDGSFYCECPNGLTLDDSGRRCIDTRKSVCFPNFNATHPFCHEAWEGLHSRQTCCCSIAGEAWGEGNECRACPREGTPEYDELCPCADGNCYNPNPNDRENCKQINNCLEFPEICGEFGECKFNPENPADLCQCAPGFGTTDKGFPCVDIDECALLGEDACGEGECVNTPGSFKCKCKPGYVLGNDGVCVNDDECLNNVCLGGGQCRDTEGSFECECPPNTHLADDGVTCEDDNECDLQIEPCINGRCINLIGDWKCQCHSGYKPTPDNKGCVNTNECLDGNGGCEQRCTDTEGSFICSCRDGYELSPNGFDCIDVDECSEEPAICGGGKCENLEGSYTCHCIPGYELVSNRQLCIDVNECDINPDICIHGKCTNTEGSYTCDCWDGFCIAPDLSRCDDENECELGTHICSPNAECNNNIGTYQCHCQTGFDGDGVECSDVDECESDTHGCHPNADCINIPGGYNCECHPGYVGNGTECADVMDCDQDPNICGPHGVCINSPGDYNCECEFGYTPSYNGKRCEDINECKGDKPVCKNGNCVNMDGTYACECHEGYELNDEGDQCVDTNECSSETEDTSICLGGKCRNTIGAFTCECPPNYTYIPGGSGCVDLRQGNCYAEAEYGICSDLIGPNTRRAECCCSGAGFGWAEVENTIENTCEVCPAVGSAEHLQLCPYGPGFEPDSIRLIPKDINECSAMAGACKGGNCRNLDGSYDCNCPEGYELDSTGRNCVDIDECASEENPCGAGQCINQLGHHQCVCEDGYIPSEDGRECEDIRMGECFKSYNPFMNPSCDDAFSFKATKKACCCANDLGKAWGDGCEECPQGDARIAFCKDAKSACDQIPDLCRDGYCIEDPGHDIKCECRPGMTLKPGSYECIDNDECADPNTKCPQFSHCVNKKGSYDCICDDGFTERNGVCVNIDECSMIEGTCANGKCTDTVGGFHCECDNGYESANDNKSCVNIDECNDYPNICGSPGAVKHCIDLEGSHRCVCNPGYEFNREDEVCVNINECERFAGHDNICQNGDCVDIVGGFMCDCDDGFRVSDDSRTCVDVDECEEYGNPCVSGECINLNGNYTCQCDPGYTFNGESCVNIDECQTVPGLCSHGNCEDLEGGFQCHCPHGYTQTSDGTDCFDERQGKCFVGSRSCNNDALGQLLTQSQCCCMCNGDNSWSYRGGCGKCPAEGSAAFDQMCPEGCGMSTGPDGHPIDINECDLIDTACTNGTCVNTDSSYKCDCGKGYHLDADGTTCVDTDECAALVNPCGRGECANDEGGFTCECEDGYAATGPNGSCQDIDECATGAHQCAYRCKNESPQNGKYSCLCPSGYELKPDGRHCKDINECAQNPDPCALKGQVCKNFVGYYVCQCPNGMRRNPVTDQCQDIDECAENADLCDNGTCINKPNGGGFWCKCKPGFVANNDMTKCDDSREYMCYTTKVSGMCLQTAATMSSAAVRFDECCCSGHGAGWGDGRTQKYNAVECRSCPDKDSAAFRELCPAGIGYDKNGNVINDCDVVPNACENGICVNNQPGFTCMCDEGYTIDETGTKCIDTDECATNAHKCPAPAMCQNTDGAYDCICPEGYQMIDNVCVDLDECKTKNNNCQYICTNTIGSYECECPVGYKKRNNACVDRNECDEQFNICGPRGICVNDPGSFHCICKRGYRLNDSGDECVDLNECQSRYGCPTGCFNTPGGFRCPQQCPPGYMHFRGRCVDVNECNSSPCGAGQVCNNFRGSFQCNCQAGYRQDAAQSCSDVDECKINGGTCANGCNNEDGNYSCTCGPDSYKAGNGHCISTQRSFTQPGYHRGWNAGQPAGRGSGSARVIGGERRCYGGSCHSRRHSQRYRRDTHTEKNITLIVDSMDPQAAIIDGVPIEIDLTRADYLNEPTRFMKLLELVPSHSPLKQNVRYHVESGNGKGIFKIVQHQTHATLLVSKDKFNSLHSGSYNLVIKGISTLDDDVIGILSENVDTIRRDLQNPLPGLEIFISIDNTTF